MLQSACSYDKNCDVGMQMTEVSENAEITAPALWKMVSSRSALSIFNSPVRNKFLISARYKSDVDYRMQIANDHLGLNPLPSSRHPIVKLQAALEVSYHNQRHISPSSPCPLPLVKPDPSSGAVRARGKGMEAPQYLTKHCSFHDIWAIVLRWLTVGEPAPIQSFIREVFFERELYANHSAR